MAEYPLHSRHLKCKSTNTESEFKIDDVKFILEKLYYLALYFAPVKLPGTALNPSVQISPATHIPSSLSKKSVHFITNGFKSSWATNAEELANIKVSLV
jgi:hypothetical protein